MSALLISTRRRGSVCLALALVSFAIEALWAQDAQPDPFQIDNLSVDPPGAVRLRYTARTNSYYILYRGTAVTQIQTPAVLSLGSSGTAEFVDQLASRTATFYRVRRVPITQPLDTDGDGVDDVFELQHPNLFNPLDPTDTQHNFFTDGQGNLVKYEPFASTHLATAAEMDDLKTVAEDGTLTFSPSSPMAASLSQGDVLVGGISPAAPQGLLRVVLGMDRDADGNLVVSTAAAPLQLAFRQLAVRAIGEVDPFANGTFRPAPGLGGLLRSQAVRQTSGDVTKSQNFQIIVFDGDGNTDTTQDQVKIDATLSGGFKYDLSINVDWGAILDIPNAVKECIASFKDVLVGQPPKCSVEDLLPEVKLVFSVDPKLGAQVTVAGAAVLAFEKDFDIGVINLPPIAIPPLVFLPTVDVLATVSGKASARFSVGAHASVELESKATLSSKRNNSGIDSISLKNVDVGTDDATVDLFAEAEAKIGARLSLGLYGFVGPYATASAVARLTANPLSEPCWNLNFGIEGELGVRVTSPRLPLFGYVTLLDWHAPPFQPFDETVASGNCLISDEGAHPPGGGPSAKMLQTPGFVPWSKVLGGPIDASNAGDVISFAQAFPFLEPSIDGRYVASGGGALGLLKLDDHGDGSLTWTRQIIPNVPFARPLKSLASIPTTDAGLLTLYEPTDQAAFVLAKQNQAGDYQQVRIYSLPLDCVATPNVLANDQSNGYIVAGTCRATGNAWVAHLDSTLHLIRVRMLVDTDPNTIHLIPTVAVRTRSGLALAGERALANQQAGEGAQMFILRLDDQENPSAAVSYSCPERSALWPTAGTPSADDAITIVGDATGTSFVARFRKDDTLGFITFPQLGEGVRDWFVPSAVAELPTTGLIVGYSAGVLAGAPAVVGLLGLDGAGHTLWANSYALTLDGSQRPMAWPALHITDDGGILVTAAAAPASGSTETGALVAIKVFAKNGYLGTSTPVAAASLIPTDGTHPVFAKPFAPTIVNSTGTEEPFAFQP